MKKITIIIVGLLVCHLSIGDVLCYLPTPQQERFGPQAELRSVDTKEFGKPKDMVNIVSNRPVAARDKYGNRLYFTPNGKLTLKISNDGSKEFSLSTKSKEVDKEGNLQKVTEKEQGNTKITIKNEKGEILGYQELGLGGKVVKEYDKDMNLTKSYEYNKYGKSMEWVLDELSQTKTHFNEKGQALNDIDFEGNTVAYYKYDEDNKLVHKEDVYGNKTYFDKKGNLTRTEDINGNLMVKYYYKKDEKGNTVLDTLEDVRTKDVTYFENGKQQFTLNYAGEISKEYQWDGSKLAFMFDKETKETTYYDTNGKPIHVAYNEFIVKEWLYYNGRLAGFYDERTKSTLLYKSQRDDIKIFTETKPTAKLIQKWYDEGLIDKARIIGNVSPL